MPRLLRCYIFWNLVLEAFDPFPPGSNEVRGNAEPWFPNKLEVGLHADCSAGNGPWGLLGIEAMLRRSEATFRFQLHAMYQASTGRNDPLALAQSGLCGQTTHTSPARAPLTP